MNRDLPGKHWFLLMVIFGLLVLSGSFMAPQDGDQQRLKMMQQHYPRRVGHFKNTGGQCYTLHIQSIDGGRRWLLVTKYDEVRGYLRDFYPELDAMNNFKPVE